MKVKELFKAYTEMPVRNKKLLMLAAYMKTQKQKVYGWHVDPTVADPAQAVTYLADAVGKTPAAMGASAFSYGDWENAFFMPRPCMLRSSGIVAYYLDPADYSKKADGTASDVANADFDGNAMMEWPLIWYKFESLEDRGYRRVEYLQSSGTQYIDTDMIPDYSMKLQADIQLGSSRRQNGNGGILGTIAGERRFAITSSLDNQMGVYGYIGYPWTSSTVDSYRMWLSYSALAVKQTWILSRQQFSIGSNVRSNLPPVSQEPPESSLILFGMRNTDGAVYPYSGTELMRVYNVRIFDSSDRLIHELIPAERISDGEPGLYDIITDKFYANAGTGEFTKGAYVEGDGFFCCSDRQVDSSYKCWCNVNANNGIIPHFYTAIYNGTGTSKLRSLSGVQLTSANGSGGTSGQQEADRALANNTTDAVEWYTDIWADRVLINALLVLIGKSLDTQAVFGKGLCSGGQSAKEAYVTGTLNGRGLFWGDVSSETSGVKVFGMENFYGCVWRRLAGLFAVAAGYAYKLTHAAADGSSADSYNGTAQGYLTAAGRPSESGYVKAMKFGRFGFLPGSAEGSASAYWSDWFAGADSGCGAAGGASDASGSAGSGCLSFEHDFTGADALISTTLSCKPT